MADAVRVAAGREAMPATWVGSRWSVTCEMPPWAPGEVTSGRAGPYPQRGGEGESDRPLPEGEGARRLFVPADAARRHLAALGAQGIGLNTVAELSGVSHGSLSKIVYGEPRRGRPPSRRIRHETAERILAVAVEQASGGQRINAGPTWALVEELLDAGYSRAELARRLGSRAASPSLQIGRRLVRASTARAVEALHARLIGDRQS